MLILDTHAWIWWAAQSPRLSRQAAKAIEKADEVGVCSHSCLELAMLVAKDRLKLELDVLDWIKKALAQPGVTLLHLTPEIAVASSRLAPAVGPDPADRVIVATALMAGVPLVTCDERITHSGQIKTIW